MSVKRSDTKNISDYIKSLESATKDYGDFIKHKYAGLIVRVNCADKLDKSKGNLRRLADHVKRTARFEVTDKRFRYYRSAVSLAGGISAVPTVWHAFNKTKDKDLLIRVLSLESFVGFAQGYKRCVVEFLESENNICVGDLIEISSTYYHKDAMINLNFGMSDSIGLSNPHSVSLETVECILSYPRRLGELSIEHKLEESDTPQHRVVKLRVRRVYENEEIGMSATGVEPGKRFNCKVFY